MACKCKERREWIRNQLIEANRKTRERIAEFKRKQAEAKAKRE
jgi:hypothetical protein